MMTKFYILISTVTVLAVGSCVYKFYQPTAKYLSSKLVKPGPPVLYSNLSTEISHELSELRRTSGYYIKGSPLMSREDILKELEPFLKVYDQRPNLQNPYGSKLMHQFALWCITKMLQPKHIIESGIYKGLGTWIMRQAAPDAQLILLDPSPFDPPDYKDMKKDTLHFTNSKFIDFNTVAWNEVIAHPEKTLVFIDDHQYPIRRLQGALKAGFKHVVFDDNYNSPSDVFSLRCLSAILLKNLPVRSFTYKDQLSKAREKFNQREALQDVKEMFSDHIKTYWEFPMLWRCLTCNTNKDNYNALFNDTSGVEVLRKAGLKNIPSASELRDQYYNIAYVNLVN